MQIFKRKTFWLVTFILSCPLVFLEAVPNSLVVDPQISSLRVSSKRNIQLSTWQRVVPEKSQTGLSMYIPTTRAKYIYAAKDFESDTKKCRLRLFEKTGEEILNFNCPNGEIAISGKRRLFWIAKTSIGVGRLRMHFRSHQFQGLTSYNFGGKPLVHISSATTGRIGSLKTLEDGSLMAVTEGGVLRISTHGEVAHVAKGLTGVTRLDVYQGGFFSTQEILWESRERVATLFDQAGAIIAKFKGPHEQFPLIVGVSPEARVYSVAFSSGRKSEVRFMSLDKPGNILKTIKLRNRVNSVFVSDDLKIIAYDFGASVDGIQQWGYRAQEMDDTILFEQLCARDKLGLAWIESTSNSMVWSCDKKSFGFRLSKA